MDVVACIGTAIVLDTLSAALSDVTLLKDKSSPVVVPELVLVVAPTTMVGELMGFELSTPVLEIDW